MRFRIRSIAAAIALVLGAPAAKGGIESFFLSGELDPEIGGRFSGAFSYRTFSGVNPTYCANYHDGSSICWWPLLKWNITVRGGWFDGLNFSGPSEDGWENGEQDNYVQIASGATRLQGLSIENWHYTVFLDLTFEGAFKQVTDGPVPFPHNPQFRWGAITSFGAETVRVTHATVTPEPPVAVLTAFVLLFSGGALLRRATAARGLSAATIGVSDVPTPERRRRLDPRARDRPTPRFECQL